MTLYYHASHCSNRESILRFGLRVCNPKTGDSAAEHYGNPAGAAVYLWDTIDMRANSMYDTREYDLWAVAFTGETHRDPSNLGVYGARYTYEEIAPSAMRYIGNGRERGGITHEDLFANPSFAHRWRQENSWAVATARAAADPTLQVVMVEPWHYDGGDDEMGEYETAFAACRRPDGTIICPNDETDVRGVLAAQNGYYTPDDYNLTPPHAARSVWRAGEQTLASTEGLFQVLAA